MIESAKIIGLEVLVHVQLFMEYHFNMMATEVNMNTERVRHGKTCRKYE